MFPTLVIALAITFIFLLSVLTGSGLVTHAQDARGRRQAATQRQLNDQWRLLREKQEAAEDELRWLSKQQAGLVVRDYQPPRRRRVVTAPAPEASAVTTSDHGRCPRDLAACGDRPFPCPPG